MPTNVIVWVAESTWTACVDAARGWVPTDADIVLLQAVATVNADVKGVAADAGYALERTVLRLIELRGSRT